MVGTANLNGMGTIAVSAREAIEAQALVCGMIACIDDASSRVLDSLAEAGLADDTVLVCTVTMAISWATTSCF